MDGFCDHRKLVFEAMGCCYHFCSSQEVRPSLTDQVIERGNRKRHIYDLRDEYIKEKDTICRNVGVWEVQIFLNQ